MYVVDVDAFVPRRITRSANANMVLVEPLAPVASPRLFGHFRHVDATASGCLAHACARQGGWGEIFSAVAKWLELVISIAKHSQK